MQPSAFSTTTTTTTTTTIASLILRCSSASHLHQVQANLTTSGLLLPSLFLHNLLIRAHSQTHPHSLHHHHPLLLYSQLLRSGLLPTSHTFSSLLKSTKSPILTPLIHSHSLKLNLISHTFVLNSLLHSYSSSPSSLPSALLLLSLSPPQQLDPVSFTTLISSLLNLGRLPHALHLFDQIPHPGPSTWSAIISGSLRLGRSDLSLSLFRRSLLLGSPDDRSIVSALSACAHLGALHQGKWIHNYINSNNRRLTVFLGTALIDMYSKCGEADLAMLVFNTTCERNLLVWTAAIKGLAMHGRGVEALQLFDKMQSQGITPDDITLIGALCACTHAGLVDRGRELFSSTSNPKIEHYGCMVDLLARNGALEEAKALIDTMPMEPDAAIWGALMAGCRFHKNVELAELSVEHLLKLESDHSGVYVLLANVYASSGRHEEARKVRAMMERTGVEKSPGCSSIEVDGTVHQFFVGDASHPRMKEIVGKWEEVERRLRSELGYVPDRGEVLLDIDEEEKDGALTRHSERMAIAFGLMSTEDGVRIRVVKNLRVCGDCHEVTKLVSKVYRREIVVRDRSRFHLFKEGSCSCKDYW